MQRKLKAERMVVQEDARCPRCCNDAEPTPLPDCSLCCGSGKVSAGIAAQWAFRRASQSLRVKG